ncbi:hypothetical protein BRADI_2g04193v3 [Brachypodium distachyon]|uniref:Uncharacterized protein n=1 Tax=Brachypodium distachyon TaxID=15368 RepID=A0A0Q3FXB4_BRADI|nr:hypothetical protein BRADI_2g04193v3 [Brachypodium distachyon]
MFGRRSGVSFFQNCRNLSHAVSGQHSAASVTWLRAGPLAGLLPALYSHSLAPSTLVADAVWSGGLALSLQCRLTAAAGLELDALRAALHDVVLSSGRTDGGWGARCLLRGACLLSTRLARSRSSFGSLGMATLGLASCCTPGAVPPLRCVSAVAAPGRISTICCSPVPGCVVSMLPFGVGVNRLGSAPTFASFCTALRTSLRRFPTPVANSLVLLILWVIWKRRNRCVFDGVRPSNQQLAALLLDRLKLWVHRFPPCHSACPVIPWCTSVCEMLR